jgi:hypothetical protein
VRSLLALFVLGAAIGSLGCTRHHGATGVSVDPALGSLVPADTKALGAVDVDKLKASDFYKRHRNELKIPMLDTMAERTGFDPRRDISELLVAWNGKEFAGLARGRFDPNALKSNSGMAKESARYRNYTLFEDDHRGLALLKHNVAVAGPVAMVRREIDLAENGDGGVPGELEERLAVIPKGDQVWVASRGGLAFSEVPMRSDIESALSNIVSYISATSFGIGFDSGTHVNAEIICVSTEGAERVRDALRGGIGLARLTTRDNEMELLRAYDAIQVSQDQQTVRVKADISGELTDKLLAYLPHVSSRAGEVLRER